MSAEGTPTRILITAGCFADAESAIRLVDRVLTAPSAELGGVLVEDDNLANILRLPKQKVVTSAGSVVVPPSDAQVASLQKGDARAFQERLAAIARTRSFKWSFERRRGDLIRGVLEDVKSWDILLLGHRELHKRQGQIVVFSADHSKTGRAGQLARDLAAAMNTSVRALSLSAPPDKKDRTEEPGVSEGIVPKMLSHLNRINASAVVLDLSESPLQDLEQLRHVLDAARCPVVMLGAEKNQRPIVHTTTTNRSSSEASQM